jgi:hypothetical protein
MASLGCGINSILDRIDNIRAILRKYSIVANAIATYIPATAAMITVNIPFAEFFSKIGNSVKATSLYQKIQEAYSIAKTGYEYIVAVQKAVEEIQKDFGDVVSNLSGILQDLQDLTVLDIQVLELDLAKLGFNPGEVITRLKNGENIDQVLGDAKAKLSASSSALIDKISKPLTISFDTTCQKLPNVVMLEVGNVRTPIILPTPPQRPNPEPAKVQVVPPVTTVAPNSTVTAAPPNSPAGTKSPIEGTLEVAKGSPYGFKYFADTGFSSGYKISRDWSKTSATLSSKLGIDSVTLLKYIEINLDTIGYYIAAPLKKAYPDITFTSGWRPLTSVARNQNKDANAVSWHSYGCAFDFIIPAKYYKSSTDNPMVWVLNRVRNLQVGPGTARVGHFQLLREEDPGDKIEQIVWHVGAKFVPIGTNSYNGDKVRIGRIGRKTKQPFTYESAR